MSEKIFNRIIELLDEGEADYRSLEHETEGRCQEVSDLRGNLITEANKALVIRAKRTKKSKQKDYFLLALRADTDADFSKIGPYEDIRLCQAEKVLELTDCIPGTVPPFSFHPELQIIVDPLLLENERFWFNAGMFKRSICLNSQDYVRLTNPIIRNIHRDTY